MRYFFSLITIVILLSCKEAKQKINEPVEWTEAQKRKFFTDSFSTIYGYGMDEKKGSVRSFSSFFNTHYPETKSVYNAYSFPYALEEEYIDTTKIDTGRSWFRIIVQPSFRLPYCFVLEKKDGKSFLTTKITNGDGGYHTGVLMATLKFSFGDTMYDYISQKLNSLNFWKLGNDTTCGPGVDGENWMFEFIENGKYNVLSRWSPDFCGDSTTLELSKIGFHLGKLSKLDNILKAIDGTSSWSFSHQH